MDNTWLPGKACDLTCAQLFSEVFTGAGSTSAGLDLCVRSRTFAGPVWAPVAKC